MRAEESSLGKGVETTVGSDWNLRYEETFAKGPWLNTSDQVGDGQDISAEGKHESKMKETIQHAKFLSVG